MWVGRGKHVGAVGEMKEWLVGADSDDEATGRRAMAQGAEWVARRPGGERTRRAQTITRTRTRRGTERKRAEMGRGAVGRNVVGMGEQ